MSTESETHDARKGLHDEFDDFDDNLDDFDDDFDEDFEDECEDEWGVADDGGAGPQDLQDWKDCVP
jgi:hypothetical protein